MANLKPKVYLCGPINACTDEECKDWRERVKKELDGVVDFIDPMARDYRGKELEPDIAKQIVENDKSDIDQSDLVLVYYEKPSVGTSMEILYAFDRGIYITLVDTQDKPLSPWLLYHASYIVGTLDAALVHIKVIADQFSVYEVQEWDDEI